MSLYPPPEIIEAKIWSRVPEDLRIRDQTSPWSVANKPGEAVDCFLEGPSFDRQGNLYLVDIPNGRILRVSPQGQLSCLISNAPSPNGLALSASERILYVTMTRDNSVWRLPLMLDGGVSKVRRFLQLSGGLGGPDGMAMDEQDRLFVAHAGNGCVWCFDRLGAPVYRIVSPRGITTTNLAFGGEDNRSVFITESETGTVLRADLDVPGATMYAHV